jgi:hypothetical protein
MQAMPELSVILIAKEQRESAARSLESLVNQRGVERAEILLIDMAAPGTAPLPGADHPSVRALNAEASPNGELGAMGVHEARGRIVAFLEDHCVVFPGWIEATIDAFDGPWDAVGGEIHSGNPGVGVSDAVALMNHTAWRPPMRRRETVLLPGHNAAYRRDVLLSYGDDLIPLLQSEPLLHWRMAAEGCIAGLDPNIKFYHLNETVLKDIWLGYYLWNRVFGAQRVRFQKWSPLKVALYALATPLVPVVRTAKMLKEIRSEHPQDVEMALLNLPAILVIHTAAALGMAAGYLLGAGDADRRFSDLQGRIQREIREDSPAHHE